VRWETPTAKLEEAAAAYREALKEQTRERVPLQWAGAQNNLGNALWRLGERENASVANIGFFVGLQRVPSRVVLEFGDAISGISRVSGQAARSIG
jgi:hypothetical protein